VRIFRSDDGAELREEDVERVISTYVHRSTEWGDYDERHAAACRIIAALAPKTCGAILPVMMQNVGGRGYSGPQRCVLPPEHHPATDWDPERHLLRCGDKEQREHTRDCAQCGRDVFDPIHASGHMTAPECWREP
jgi:hypothetical protein